MAITPVTEEDIQDGVTTGAQAAALINDEKRAINEVIAAANGGGGPEVLRDWTSSTITNGGTLDFLDGLTLTEGLNGIEIEIRNFQAVIQSGVGSTAGQGLLRLIHGGESAAQSAVARRTQQISATITNLTGTSAHLFYLDHGGTGFVADAKISLGNYDLETTKNGRFYAVSNTINQNFNSPTSGNLRYNRTEYQGASFHATLPADGVSLGWGAGYDVQLDYRVLKVF